MATLTIDATLVKPLVGSIISPKVLGAASKVGRVVYVDDVDPNKVYEADADGNATATGQLGIIVGGGLNVLVNDTGVLAAGAQVDVLWFGRLVLGVTLDPNKQYYLANTTSSVDGLIGDAAGSVSRRLGKPESAKIFFFNPQDVATVSA